MLALLQSVSATRWAALDQVFSSSVNFVLAVAAGRLLGSDGLGSVSIGFSIYLLVLGLGRTLVIQPLVAVTAASAVDKNRIIDARGLLTVLVGAGLAAAATGLLSLVTPMGISQGLLAFSPWLVPTLLFEYCRSLMYRDRRASHAALSSFLWFVVASATILLGRELLTIRTLVALWGGGATIGALMGYTAVSFKVRGSADFLAWWSANLWPASRWHGLASAIVSSGAYAVTIVLALVLTTSDVGGLRAIQSLFAPLSLIGPALALPGFPRIAALESADLARATVEARKLSVKSTVLVAGAVLMLSLGGHRLLNFFYGAEFERYAVLILPVGFGQLAAAAAGGLVLLLQSQRRTLELLAYGVIGSVTSLGAAWILAASHGLVAATWGLAAGPMLSLVYLFDKFSTHPKAVSNP